MGRLRERRFSICAILIARSRVVVNYFFGISMTSEGIGYGNKRSNTRRFLIVGTFCKMVRLQIVYLIVIGSEQAGYFAGGSAFGKVFLSFAVIPDQFRAVYKKDQGIGGKNAKSDPGFYIQGRLPDQDIGVRQR